VNERKDDPMLTVVNNVTLDGIMESPEEWAAPYADEVLMQRAQEGMARTSVMLLGRRTYEQFAAFWPHQTDGNPFTEHLNRVHKYVVSTTLEEPLPWVNSSVLAFDDVSRLDERATILGSGELIRSLMERDLIDEFQLNIHPLVVGSGQRLFTGGSATFQLVDATPTTTGVVIATYRRGEAR
jgi:dihydrofolate reductase